MLAVAPVVPFLGVVAESRIMLIVVMRGHTVDQRLQVDTNAAGHYVPPRTKR